MIEDLFEQIFGYILEISLKYKISSIGAILLIFSLILKTFNYNSNLLIILSVMIIIFGFIIKK